MSHFYKFAGLSVLISLVAWGCSSQAPSTSSAPAGQGAHDHDHGDHDHGDHEHGDHEHAQAAAGETTPVALYCGDCGFAKGTEQCCQEGAEKCASCGMAKGSTLCCQLEGDFAGKTLCGKCGQVSGTEACCAAGAEACASCGLAKGSPLCCNLSTDAKSDQEPGAPETTPEEN